MDDLWCRILQKFHQHPDWALIKEKKGVYRMGHQGGRKILCQVSHAGLQVRVGGGWMDAESFLDKYGPTEMGTAENWGRGADRSGHMDTPPSMERLLVPTKCWASKIGISTTPDLREQRHAGPIKPPVNNARPLCFVPVSDAPEIRSETLLPHSHVQPREIGSAGCSPVLSPREALASRGRASTSDTIITTSTRGESRVSSPLSSLGLSDSGRHRNYHHANTLQPRANFSMGGQEVRNHSWSMVDLGSAQLDNVSGNYAFRSSVAADGRPRAAPPPLTMSLDAHPLAAQLNRERTSSTLSAVTMPPLSPATVIAEPRSNCGSISLDSAFFNSQHSSYSNPSPTAANVLTSPVLPEVHHHFEGMSIQDPPSSPKPRTPTSEARTPLRFDNFSMANV